MVIISPDYFDFYIAGARPQTWPTVILATCASLLPRYVTVTLLASYWSDSPIDIARMQTYV